MLFLREWYMHPNGQLPAYEFALRGREPSRARLGRLAGLQDDGRSRRARPGVPRPRLSQAPPQLHVVGEPEGHATGSNLFSGGFLGLDNIGVFDRSQALPDGRTARASGRHRLDGLLLRDDALHGAGARERGSRLRGRRLQVLRALHEHRRRDELPRRHRSLGRRGRVLLRPAPGGRPAPPAADRARMVGVIPLFAVRGARAGGTSIGSRLLASASSGFCTTARTCTETMSCIDTAARRSMDTVSSRIPPRDRLVRVLRYVLDEEEFLSPYGLRSLVKVPRRASFRVPDRRRGLQRRATRRVRAPRVCSAATPTGAAPSGSR